MSAPQIYNAEQKVKIITNAFEMYIDTFVAIYHQTTLRPVLPEDLVLHFHISSAMLVLTILTVTQIARTPTTPNVSLTAARIIG